MIIVNTLAIFIALASQKAAGQLTRNFFFESNGDGGLNSVYNPGNAASNNGLTYLNQAGLSGCLPVPRTNEYLTANPLPNPQRAVKGPYRIVIQSQGQSRIEAADENGNVRGVVYYSDPQYGYPKTISYEGNLASGIRRSSYENPSLPFHPNRLVLPFMNSNDINHSNNEDDESMNVVNAIFNGKVKPNSKNPWSLSGLPSQQYQQQLQRLTANPAAPFLRSAQLNSLPSHILAGGFLPNVEQFWPRGQLPFNPSSNFPISAPLTPLQRLELPGNGLIPFASERGSLLRQNMGVDPSQVLQTLGRIQNGQQQDPQSVSFGGNIQSRTAGDGSRGIINGRISWLGNNDQQFPEQEELDNLIPAANSLAPNQFSSLVPNSFVNQAGNQFQRRIVPGLTDPASVGNVIGTPNGFPLSSPLSRPLTQAVPSNSGQLANVGNMAAVQGNNQGRGQSVGRTVEDSGSTQQGSESGSQKSDLDYEVLVDIADKIAKLARSKNTEDSSTPESP